MSASERLQWAREELRRYDLGEGSLEGLAEALRALAEPEAVNETIEQIARGALNATLARVSSEGILFQHDDLFAMLESAVHAGIQVAWESWEPDDYAPVVCERCGRDVE